MTQVSCHGPLCAAPGESQDDQSNLASSAVGLADTFPTVPMKVQVGGLGLYQLKGVHGFLRLFTLESSAVAAAVAASPAGALSGPSQGASKNLCIQPDNSYKESITIAVLKAVLLYEEAQQMQAQLQAADALARAAHDNMLLMPAAT